MAGFRAPHENEVSDCDAHVELGRSLCSFLKGRSIAGGILNWQHADEVLLLLIDKHNKLLKDSKLVEENSG